jgi:diguanylate cyclase
MAATVRQGFGVDRHEHAQALARTALGLMAERSVAPTPENFELFYAYAAGDNPAVSRVIRDMIAGRRSFTPAVLADLRRRFFNTARAQDAVDVASHAISETLNNVLDKLESAGRETLDYGRTLNAASGELGEAQSPAGVRKLVDELVSATKTMEARTKELETELQQSSHEVSELRAKLDDVRKESLTDPLTGIANRKAFDLELAHALKGAREHGKPLSLLMCDIDHFKTFNDNWGHQTGDQVLRLVANCLSENLKGRDTAARYGGEEFAVLLPGLSPGEALAVAETIRLKVELWSEEPQVTTVSIGVASLTPTATTDWAELIGMADKALYAAKANGRNCSILATVPRLTLAA